jgi:Laminin G domain
MTTWLRILVAGSVLACLALGEIVKAESINFDADKVGSLPAGWTNGVTGRGESRWSAEADATAPSPPHVLRQSGRGDFPWCVVREALLADGCVEVKFEPVSGHEDQAGGVVWRFKDANHYYVARANALEGNVSLYYTVNGRRNTLSYVDAPVAKNQWHVLRVEFAGTKIQVIFDGKRYIEIEDERIAGPGAVGVWTKADSVTAFDDFAYGPAP